MQLTKMNDLPKHHGAGPPKAQDQMQLYRLHRLKAGPACCYAVQNEKDSWARHIVAYNVYSNHYTKYVDQSVSLSTGGTKLGM